MANRSFVNKSIRGFGSIVVYGIQFLWHALKFVASCTSPAAAPFQHRTEEHKLSIGVLNYRTRTPDDGTDPYGWY